MNALRLVPVALVISTLAAGISPAPAGAASSKARELAGVNLGGPALALPEGELEGQYRLMAKSGVRQVRVPVDWGQVQAVPGGALDLRWLDRVVLLGSSYGIETLVVALGSPPWAAAPSQRCGRCGENLLVSATQPRNPDAFAAFVGDLARRYGPGGTLWREASVKPVRPVRAWQVWNEPDLPSYWQSDSWAREYGTLLALTRRAIREVDTSALVVLAGLTNYSPDALSELFRRGEVRGRFDVAAMNLFTRTPYDQGYLLEKFRSVLNRERARKVPIWVTEWTWLSGAADPTWEFPPVISSKALSTYISSSIAILRRAQGRKSGLRKAYWYTWASSYSGDYRFDYAGLNRLGSDGGLTSTPGLTEWSKALKSVGGG